MAGVEVADQGILRRPVGHAGLVDVGLDGRLGGPDQRPRKRQLQRLPAAVAGWLDSVDTGPLDALPEAA